MLHLGDSKTTFLVQWMPEKAMYTNRPVISVSILLFHKAGNIATDGVENFAYI